MILTLVSVTLLLTTTVAEERLESLENRQNPVHTGWAGRTRDSNANDLMNAYKQFLVSKRENPKGDSNVLNNQFPLVNNNNNGAQYPPLKYNNNKAGTNYGYYQPNSGTPQRLNNQIPYGNRNPVYSENYYQGPHVKKNNFLNIDDQFRYAGGVGYDPRTPIVEIDAILNNDDQTRNPGVIVYNPRIPIVYNNEVLDGQPGNLRVNEYDSVVPVVEINTIVNNDDQIRNPFVSGYDNRIPVTFFNNNDQNRNPGFSGYDPRIVITETNDVLKSNGQTGNPGVSGYDSRIPLGGINDFLINNDQTSNSRVRVPLVGVNEILNNDDRIHRSDFTKYQQRNPYEKYNGFINNYPQRNVIAAPPVPFGLGKQ